MYEYETQMLERNLVNGQIRQRIESENEVYQSNEFMQVIACMIATVG